MTSRLLPPVRRVFADTSAYFAMSHPGDRNHTAALRIAGSLGRLRPQMFTSNFILAETHALLLTRVSRAVALRVVEEIGQSATVVVRVGGADERRAWEIIRQYDDKDFSFTDATSFAIMERLGIGAAFTFDRNFAQYGLPLLTFDPYPPPTRYDEEASPTAGLFAASPSLSRCGVRADRAPATAYLLPPSVRPPPRRAGSRRSS